MVILDRKIIRQYALLLLFILLTPVIASLLTSLFKVDVLEAFECWCRKDGTDNGSGAAVVSKIPTHVELLGAPATLTSNKQFTLPLPVFGSNPFQYTISFWIKIPQVSGSWRGILRFGPDDNSRYPAIWVAPNTTNIHYRHGSTADKNQGFDGVPGVPLNVWTHFAMVVSGRVMTPYINGVAGMPMTAGADLVLPTDRVYFAQDPATYLDISKPLTVAYVWFSNLALAPTDISGIYNAPHAGTV